jgi:hypothetical protein
VRDLIEAASQRWNTYVVGYDLRKQVRLFDAVNRRISQMRSGDKGPLVMLSKTPITGWLVVGGVLLAYVAWRRYQLRAGALRPRDEKQPMDRSLETAAALYRELETALQLHGMTRPAATPPLRYASELGERRHPLAPEIEALTQTYLELRFGGSPLTVETRRDFEKRVRDIRAYRGGQAEERRPAS